VSFAVLQYSGPQHVVGGTILFATCGRVQKGTVTICMWAVAFVMGDVHHRGVMVRFMICCGGAMWCRLRGNAGVRLCTG
jgi:hypothetical protein